MNSSGSKYDTRTAANAAAATTAAAAAAAASRMRAWSAALHYPRS